MATSGTSFHQTSFASTNPKDRKSGEELLTVPFCIKTIGILQEKTGEHTTLLYEGRVGRYFGYLCQESPKVVG